jgi:hypothetical protein
VLPLPQLLEDASPTHALTQLAKGQVEPQVRRERAQEALRVAESEVADWRRRAEVLEKTEEGAFRPWQLCKLFHLDHPPRPD